MVGTQTPETKEINLIVSQHIIDTGLSALAAHLFVNQAPADIVNQLGTKLQKFTSTQLKNSLRSVRNKYPNPNMQSNSTPQKKKRKADAVVDNTGSSTLFARAANNGVGTLPPNYFQTNNGNMNGSYHNNGVGFGNTNGAIVNGSYSPMNTNGVANGNFSPMQSMLGSGMGHMGMMQHQGHGSYAASMPGNHMNQQLETLSALTMPGLTLEVAEEGVEIELKSYHEHIALSSDYVTEIVSDSEEYTHQLELAERGSIEDKISIKGTQTKSNAGLDRVTVSTDKDEALHDRGIAAVCEERDKLTNEMETIKRKIESCDERELHLRKQKMLTIGKARAYVYIGRKALHNINQALKVGPNNMEIEEAKRKWQADIINEQKYLQNGEEESIALILKRMKSDGANGSDGV